MKFSIVIVTYNRKKELELCLQSIRAQQCKEKFEVIVIFNGELSYFEKTKLSYPEVKCFYTPSSSPSSARNYGISKISGEYIYFLDDDCQLPPGTLDKLDFNQNWDVYGGPDQTAPNSSEFQITLGEVLSSPFCMGKTHHRHTAQKQKNIMDTDESHLILCNLIFRSKIFKEEGHRFDTELFRNEENHLLKKLALEKKIIKYDPAFFVYHMRRDGWSPLAYSVMKSGECRVLNFVKLPVLGELIYFAPLLFNIFFFSWIFNLSSKLGWLFITYFSLVTLNGLFKTRRYSPTYLTMHLFILFMYSLGLVKGLFQHSWIILRDTAREYT